MIISTENTKCVKINKEPIKCKLEVKRKVTEQVFNFNYLGVNTISQGIVKRRRSRVRL